MQDLSERDFSFEFFPPRSEDGRNKLAGVLTELAAVRPAYISVTYGAGGSTREGTLDTVLAVERAGTPGAPHISCVGSSKAEIRQLLETYRQKGIRRIVALRGDLPSGAGMGDLGELRYANELVEFIRTETGDYFHIEVAAYPEFHPQAPSPALDLENFRRKVDAGADGAITQYFFNPDAYARFVEDCDKLGVRVPVVPGIMPITNYTQLARFSDACGAEIPRWIRRRLAGFGDDKASILAFGEEVVTRLCARLLEGDAPGLHFYTMNRSAPTLAIWRNLGLPGG